MCGGSTGRREDRTGGVCQFILSALDLVLQAFSLAPGSRDLGLHLLAVHIGHLDGWVPLKRSIETV